MQLSPVLHQLTVRFTVPTPAGPLPRSANLWILVGRRLVVIDSGVAGAEEKLSSYLHGLGRTPQEIDWLLLTHSHPDHIGAAAAVVESSGCRVAAHRAERGWIEDPQLQLRERPVPGFNQLVQGPVAVARELVDGEVLHFDGLPPLTVLHTPGHSMGSLSFWAPSERWLVSGDAVHPRRPANLRRPCRRGRICAEAPRLRGGAAPLLVAVGVRWGGDRAAARRGRCVASGAQGARAGARAAGRGRSGSARAL